MDRVPIITRFQRLGTMTNNLAIRDFPEHEGVAFFKLTAFSFSYFSGGESAFITRFGRIMPTVLFSSIAIFSGNKKFN